MPSILASRVDLFVPIHLNLYFPILLALCIALEYEVARDCSSLRSAEYDGQCKRPRVGSDRQFLHSL